VEAAFEAHNARGSARLIESLRLNPAALSQDVRIVLFLITFKQKGKSLFTFFFTMTSLTRSSSCAAHNSYQHAMWVRMRLWKLCVCLTGSRRAMCLSVVNVLNRTSKLDFLRLSSCVTEGYYY